MSSATAASEGAESDAPAKPAPGMGDHCTSERPVSSGQRPTGSLSQLNSIEVYISKPADYPHAPSRLLLLLTPGTGVKSINNQLQADRYAAEGFVVVMPDQFSGDAAPNSTTAAAAAEDTAGPEAVSVIERVKLGAAETAKSFLLDMWLARHTAEKVVPILHGVIESAADEFADAVANGAGLYVAGYCFGGKYAAILAGESRKRDPTGPPVKAAVIAHATLMTAEDLTAVRLPVCLVCVENDQLFPTSILDRGRNHLRETNVEHEIHIYPDVPHGFAIQGDYADPSIRRAQAEAFGQMLAWLKGH